LVERFPSAAALQAATPEDIAQIYGLGLEVGQAIATWMERVEHRTLLADLEALGLTLSRSQDASRDRNAAVFAGQTFVITGTLPQRSRSEMKTWIEARGGKVTSSLSKKTSYLLVGAEAGSKLAKAEQLGIPKLDEPAIEHLAEELARTAADASGNEPTTIASRQ
ncbi:MAG: BRCT domain-containing protein, partial [Cyanobacteria bacterium J06639_1]